MKKIRPYLISICLLCLFTLLQLFILLQKNNSPQAVILSDNTQLQSQQHTVVTSSGKLNINTATEAELIHLPGIGETLSKRIVEYRAQHGSFQQIDELLNIKGIGPKVLEKIEPYISIGE